MIAVKQILIALVAWLWLIRVSTAEPIAPEAGAGGGLGGLVNRYLSVPHADDGLRCVVSAGRLRGAAALGTGGATICGSTRRTVIASSFASGSPAGPF